MEGTFIFIQPLLRVLAVWLLFTGCLCSTSQGDTDWVLRPEAGVFFKPMGLLNAYSSTNTIYLAVSLKMPGAELVESGLPDINCTSLMRPGTLNLRYDEAYYRKKFNLQIFHDDRQWSTIVNDELRQRSAAGMDLCRDYQKTLQSYNRSLEFYRQVINRELGDIETILHYEKGLARQKRFAFAAIPFLVAAAKVSLTLGGAALAYVRHNALKKSLEGLRNNQDKINSHVVNFSNKSAFYNAYMSDNMKNLQQQVNLTRREVKALANETHKELVLLSARMETAHATHVYMTSLLSKLLNHATTLISKNLYYLFMYRGYIKHFLDGAVKLKKGQLSPHLLGPKRLRDILTQTEARVQLLSGGDLSLLSVNPADFYDRTDILFTGNNTDLIIQIPVPITKRSLGFVKLYQFQHVFVPYDTLEEHNTDYTSIKTSYTYIGTTKTHYVLLTQQQMDDCHLFSGYHVCPHELLFVHNSRDTCLYRLLTGYDLGRLSNVCDIRLHHGMKIPPALLEAPTKFLLSGFAGTWSATCDGQDLPVRRAGRGYAIIDKSSLCACSLTTQDLYLASVQHSCPNDPLAELNPVYPVNSLAWSIFYNVIANESLPDINRLFTEKAPPHVKIPKLKIWEDKRADVLLTDFSEKTIKINKITKLLKENADMYLTEGAKLTHKRQFDKWFRDLEISQIAMAVLSMLGGLCTLILFYVIYKQCALAGLVSSMVAHAPNAKASTTGTGYVIDSWDWCVFAIYQAIAILAIVSILYSAYRLIRKWCVSHRFIQPRDVYVGTGCKSVIKAEISDGLRVMLAYIATIRTHPSFLKPCADNGTFPVIVDRDSTWFTDVLHVDWRGSGVVTLASNEKIKLPEFVTVSCLQRKTLNLILTANHTVRIAIFSEGQLWYLSHQNDSRRQDIYYGSQNDTFIESFTNRSAIRPLKERRELKIRQDIAQKLGDNEASIPKSMFLGDETKFWKEENRSAHWDMAAATAARVPSKRNTALESREAVSKYEKEANTNRRALHNYDSE